MQEFIYEAFAARALFGPGRIAEIPAEVKRLGATSVLIVSSASQRARADAAAATLGSRFAAAVAGTAMHVPRENADAAAAMADRHKADCIVAIGGGSAIGLAKAVALRREAAIVAVPSTYAGSEMTDIWGISESGGKTTGRDSRVVPATVIYDADLTADLPTGIAGPSGLNAVAHSVEALYAHNVNPVLAMIAEEGIARMASGLPTVCSGAADDEARGEALYGAFLCGLALAKAAMGIHHKLCHVLGGSFGLPHAETHAVLLPYAADFNRDAAPAAMASASRALGAADAVEGLHDLAARVGAPTSLAELGLEREGIDLAAGIATETPYINPRPVDRSSVRRLLEDAFHGRRRDRKERR